VPLCLELCFNNIKLSLGFVELVAQPLNFVVLLFKLDPVPRLNVLLDLHPQDIGVDGQGHLACH